LALPKFVRRGVSVNLLLNPCQKVELDNFAAIGSIGKLESEDFSIVLGLLQTISSWRFVGFCLNNS